MVTVRQLIFIHLMSDEDHFIECCILSSLSDETPEGKSIVELGETEMAA